MKDATEKARAICARLGAVSPAAPAKAAWRNSRTLAGEGFSAYPKGSGTERLFVSEFGFLSFGDEQVDLRGLYNLATTAQQTALAFFLRHVAVTNSAASFDPSAALDALLSKTEIEGLDAVFSSFFTDCDRFLDQPRKIELLLALFRMRHVRFLPAKGK